MYQLRPPPTRHDDDDKNGDATDCVASSELGGCGGGSRFGFAGLGSGCGGGGDGGDRRSHELKLGPQA